MLEIPAKELVCVGSYDMGVFLRSKAPLLHQVSRTYDICFVSGYRPQIESATETDPFYKILRDAHDRLLAHTVRLCHENDLSLLIVGRQRHPVKDEVFPEEEDYFNKRCTSCDFDILCSSKPSLSSYAGVLSAEAVVHLYSTLGWEALGVKKKVLFGGGINSEMLEPMDILYWVKFLPECLLLDSASFSEFSTKVLRLLAMDKQQYVEIAGRAGKYYMDQNQDHPPHEVIRDRIKLALS